MGLELTVVIIATAVVAVQGYPGLGIFNGSKADLEDYPYMVSIHVDNSYNCIGTIVNDQWLVTTPDAVSGMSPSQVTVCVGCEDGTPSTGVMMNVSTIVVHPNYTYSLFDYEYACIKVNGSFTWSDIVKPADLPDKQPKAGVAMKVAGWGDTGELDSDYSRQLMGGKMNWLHPNKCNNTLSPYGLEWTDRMGCVFDKSQSKTTLCKGDWGAPVVQGNTLYGMMVAAPSRGMCSSSAAPVLLANIASASDWIRNTIGA